MRVLWLIPLMTALIVGAGLPILGAAGVAAHSRAAFAAAAITLLAGLLSAIPLWLTRTATLPSRVQAGLVATLVHMMVAAALSLVEMKVGLGGPFTYVIYWLLPLYWSTLIILVVAITRTLRPVHPLRQPPESPNIVTSA